MLSVFNAESVIAQTIASILSQHGPSFELIIVEDGSTDDTHLAIELSIRGAPNVTLLLNASNQGLTRSLIQGCGQASGKFIARIDAGDRYLPGRLAHQFEMMEACDKLGLVSCGTRFMSAEGDLLYSISQSPEELAEGLARTDLNTIRGPSHHGSTMMRRSVYERVGGYRPCFRVAQDLDLWMRIFEVSQVCASPKVLYESTIHPQSISLIKRQHQIETAKLIMAAARCRRAGLGEPDFLKLPVQDRSEVVNKRQLAARYDYFVASCLAKRDPAAARKHFRRAWAASPFNFRYGLRFMRSYLP